MECWFFQDNLVEMLVVHAHRHLVDARHVYGLDDSVGRHVAEQCHLAAHCCRDFLFCAQDKHVGLDAHLLQLLYRVLRRLRLQLLCGVEKRHICQVDADAVRAKLPFQLTHALEKRQRLDVAHGAADFRDYEIVFAGVSEQFHVAFDFVGDVRDNLHRLAEIVSAALLVDDALVDTSGGDVVRASSVDVGETLIVTEVEVGLVAVDSHIAFAMLVGVQCTRIDVDIRVKLLDSHSKTARKQQSRQ